MCERIILLLLMFVKVQESRKSRMMQLTVLPPPYPLRNERTKHRPRARVCQRVLLHVDSIDPPASEHAAAYSMMREC